MYVPDTTWTRLFLSVAVFQSLAAVPLECYILIAVERCFEPPVMQVSASRTVPMFFALFILGFVYELILVYDALRSSSMMQVVGLCLYNLCLLIYAAFQPQQIKAALDSLATSFAMDTNSLATVPLLTPGSDPWGDVKPALIALALVVALATGSLCFFAHKLRSEFAWLVYKVVHADPSMKRRVLILQTYVALLKFDFFFLLGFFVQSSVNLSANMGDPEFGVSIGAILVAGLVVWLGLVSALRENRVGTLAVLLTLFVVAAFLSYKLATLQRQLYMLVFFAAATLVMMLCTIVLAVLCLVNFDKGVKTYTRSQHRQTGCQEDFHNLRETAYASPVYGFAPRRLSLD